MSDTDAVEARGVDVADSVLRTAESPPLHWEGPTTNFDDFKRLNAVNMDSSLVHAAVESAYDAILITEANLNSPGPRIEYVNTAFTRMTGWSVDEIIGQTPRVLQGPRTDKGLLVRLRKDLEHSKVFHGETINYRKDGTEYHVEWRITPLTDDNGDVIKWVAIQREVTERVKSQERDRQLFEERAARAELERQGHTKDEFLATLSHELRTPLHAIVGWSSILHGKIHDQEARDGLAVIARNARVQAQLIEDMLDMSRIITGNLRLEISRVDLTAVVDAAVQSVRHAAEARGVTLQQSVHSRPLIISGDPVRLQQVFWNLLSNAVKFTPAGGHVFITSGISNGFIEIGIRDTGVGIKSDFLPHAFERFRQADSSSCRIYSGLGLGLGIVKHITELHGGHVRGESDGEGKGSMFTISLPNTLSYPDEENTDSGDASRLDTQSEEPLELNGMRALVVDDDADARNMIKQLLCDCAAVVITAASAEEALKALDDGVPDVLVSDIGMPRADGYELIKAVRKRPPRAGRMVPAVAMTAFARSEDRRRALTAGFDMHVAKPIEPEELVAVVARLGSRRLD